MEDTRSSSSSSSSMSISASRVIRVISFSLLATVISLASSSSTTTTTTTTTAASKQTTNKVIATKQRQSRRRQQQQQSIFISNNADDNSNKSKSKMSSNIQASSHYKSSSILALRQSSSSTTTTTASTMEGTCSGTYLTSGQVQFPGFILCYPMTDDNPIYKFGVDSAGRLSYYINNTLYWYATPPITQTSACIFGGSCVPPTMEYIRLNAAGSLGGFDVGKNKIWDSHVDGGTYTELALIELGSVSEGGDDFVLEERQNNSTLELMQEGVVIHGADGVATWMIRAPLMEDAADSSTSSTSDEEISVSGVIFLDSNGDGFMDSNSSSATTFEAASVELGGMAVDMYDCADAEKLEWLLIERTNSSGYYEFESMDLMPLLTERGTTRFRVVVTLPDSMSGEYTFSPSSSDSDVDPDGQTACWDLVVDGKQRIVWNAGITEVAANVVPASTTRPSLRPTFLPTAKPSPNSDVTVEDAAIESSAPSSASTTITSPATNSSVIISGLVFQDVNNNGYFELHDETTMSDVRVELVDCDGKVISSTSTDANGMYGFSELVPGSFVIRFSPEDGFQLGDIWTGLSDGEGNMIAKDANNHANPNTGSTDCKEYQAGSAEYSINAGMISEDASSMPSAKPSEDPKGDGTHCSGVECPIDGMCRNKSGLCGSGVSFCNPESVWDPTCSDFSSTSDEANGTICNEDGSVGLTSDSAGEEEKVKSTVLSFTYALNGANGTSPDANSIAKFEKELNSRLACTYFDDPCLACDNNDGRRARYLRRGVSFRARFLDSVKDSSVTGISSLPKDEKNMEKACSDDTQPGCVVVDGKFTVYFPDDMTPEAIEEESDQLLSAVKSEMEKNDWDGMQVRYETTLVRTAATAEYSSATDSGGGLSNGGIAGIILAILVLVAVVGVLLTRYIRNKREDDNRKPLKEQLEVQLNSGDLESIQPRQDDPYESDSDSSSSSSDSSSDSSESSTSSEEGEEEDDVRSSSVISGDSFPSNVAQATPSVLEVDYSSGEEDERTTNTAESEISCDIKKTVLSSRGDVVDHEKNHQLQQSIPTDYNVDQAHDANHFADDIRDRRDGYPSQNYIINDDNDDDDERSVNSSDPPGTSYRDLPQEYDWDSAILTGAPPPHAHSRATHKNSDRFTTDDLFDESSQRFDVFESESQSSGQSGNSRQRFAPRIGHGLDGLFLGNRTDQSQGSHDSQGSHGSSGSGSHRSVRNISSSIARPFISSQGDQRNVQYVQQDHSHNNQDYDEEFQGLRGFNPIRSDGSLHSRHSGNSQGESGPYVDNDHNFNDQDYMYDNQDYNMAGNSDYIRDNYGNMGGYDHNQFNPPMYNMESGNNFSREYETDSMPPMEGNTMLSPMNTRAYYDKQVLINNHLDAENYQYPQNSNRPEELDEISRADTESTDKRSNASFRTDNVVPSRELNEDSEESITSIFKSLSDIQTRLASKGKQQQPAVQTEQGEITRKKTRKVSGNAYAPVGYQQPPNNAAAGAWEKEGIVEDASMDGSQFSNFSEKTSQSSAKGRSMDRSY